MQLVNTQVNCMQDLKNKIEKRNLICLRPFNTFGPFQSEKAIIPEIIIKCLMGKPVFRRLRRANT